MSEAMERLRAWFDLTVAIRGGDVPDSEPMVATRYEGEACTVTAGDLRAILGDKPVSQHPEITGALERVLAHHADLAPEFAAQAAEEWAANYEPVECGPRVMFVQPSTLGEFNNDLRHNITFHRKMQFPFTHPVEVNL